MGGTAVLDDDVLVDSLVTDVIDGLREDLHPQFGVRAYRAWAVLRTWTGRQVGEGTVRDVVAEIRPQPRVLVWDGLRYVLAVCGLSELGQIKLTEVSLTYTFAEIAGGNLTRSQQFFIALTEAYGQGQPARYYVHTQPPFVDREKDMGWVLWLRHSEIPSGQEPTLA